MALQRFMPMSSVTTTIAESIHGTTSTQARRVHAAGQHSHRRVALSRGLAGRQFQLSAYQGADPQAGGRQVRRLLHGRPSGGIEHAGRCAEAQPHRHLFRAVHAAVGARGLDDHMEHAERYKRAREFYDVVTGLWDSFADDAFVRDVEQGLYFDPAKMHVLDHKGKYLKVRGPLNIARPVQGWPVIVQAGASEDGRQLAAETAEAVFTGGGSITDGQKLYADIKGRMEKVGRNPEHLKILPGAFVVVGDSVDEAKEKRALLDSRVQYDSAIASLSVQLGTDASGFDPDGQLPPIPETNASKSGR